MINTRQQGMTLIEIMIVVVILGILAALVAPQIMSKPQEARVMQAKTDLRTISNALDMYKLDNFTYPSSEQGLEALVEKPSGFPEAKNWNPSGYLKKMPADPWGNTYQYLKNDSNGTYSLFTLGVDGREGGEGFDADIKIDDL